MRGHEEASGTKYYPEGLQEKWATKDPVESYEKHLLEEGLIEAEKIEQIRSVEARDPSCPRCSRCRRSSGVRSGERAPDLLLIQKQSPSRPKEANGRCAFGCHLGGIGSVHGGASGTRSRVQ